MIFKRSVRVRLTIDEIDNVRYTWKERILKQDTQILHVSSHKPSKFALALEFRSFAGPLLYSRKMYRCILPEVTYKKLEGSLETPSNGGLPTLFHGTTARVSGELDKKLGAHRKYLMEVLWGPNVWGIEDARVLERKINVLVKSGRVNLELVLPDNLHHYLWETLCLQGELAGTLSIVRMRAADVNNGDLYNFRMSKKRVRLLTIIANPREMANLADMAQRIIEILTNVKFLWPLKKRHDRVRHRITIAEWGSTRDQIQKYITKKTFNMWFLIAHGSSDDGGLLFFENDAGMMVETKLADLFMAAQGKVPDVFILFACEIAGLGSEFVQTLLWRDVKMVIAMQAPITYEAAENFAKIWQSLDNLSPRQHINLSAFEEALWRARSSIESSEEQIIPVLFSRARYGWSASKSILVILLLSIFIFFGSFIFSAFGRSAIVRIVSGIIVTMEPTLTSTPTLSTMDSDESNITATVEPTPSNTPIPFKIVVERPSPPIMPTPHMEVYRCGSEVLVFPNEQLTLAIFPPPEQPGQFTWGSLANDAPARPQGASYIYEQTHEPYQRDIIWIEREIGVICHLSIVPMIFP